MNAPHFYRQGLEILVRERAPDEIAVVVIPSNGQPTTIDAHMQTLLSALGEIHQPRNIYYYSPPLDVGLGPRYRRNETTPRIEKVPVVKCPNMCYIIVDVVADTGQTLMRAVRMLEKQGVPLSSIWFFGYTVHTGLTPVLDKAETILEYLHTLRET